MDACRRKKRTRQPGRRRRLSTRNEQNQRTRETKNRKITRKTSNFLSWTVSPAAAPHTSGVK